MTSDDLERELAVFASSHEKAAESGDWKAANKAHDQIVSILRKMRSLDDAGLAVLRRLTGHQEAGVRSWSATYLLPLDEELATAILGDLLSGPTLTALSARIVLKQWRDGKLKLLA